jgi:hypothetical protein
VAISRQYQNPARQARHLPVPDNHNRKTPENQAFFDNRPLVRTAEPSQESSRESIFIVISKRLAEAAQPDIRGPAGAGKSAGSERLTAERSAAFSQTQPQGVDFGGECATVNASVLEVVP